MIRNFPIFALLNSPMKGDRQTLSLLATAQNEINIIHYKQKRKGNTMADDLKENWKKVGKDWASLGEDLGKSLIKSVKAGVNAATKWAESESEKAEAEAQTEEPKAEEPKTEEPKAEK